VSRASAEALDSFVRHVVPGDYPFVSTQDIEGGERWEARLSSELERNHFAILCLTTDNQTAPWLNFEAGALSKAVTRPRVIPYTIEFLPGEMAVGPLSRFQGYTNDQVGTWKLVCVLNASTERPNTESFLREGFDRWWPTLRDQMDSAASATRPQDGPDDRALLLEIRGHILEMRDVISAGSSLSLGAAVQVLADATLDPLTNLPNRRALQSRMQALEATKTPFVLAMVDIDKFKNINDRFGHSIGDRLIAVIGQALRRLLPDVNTVTRFGGDEFAILLPATPSEAVAATMRAALPSIARAAVDDNLPAVTLSVGVSSDQPVSFEEKVTQADRAMYRAKESGGNTVVIAS